MNVYTFALNLVAVVVVGAQLDDGADDRLAGAERSAATVRRAVPEAQSVGRHVAQVTTIYIRYARHLILDQVTQQHCILYISNYLSSHLPNWSACSTIFASG